MLSPSLFSPSTSREQFLHTIRNVLKKMTEEQREEKRGIERQAKDESEPGSGIALQPCLPSRPASRAGAPAVQTNSPVSSKFSRSMRPKVAQNNVCRDSKRLSRKREERNCFSDQVKEQDDDPVLKRQPVIEYTMGQSKWKTRSMGHREKKEQANL